MTPKRPPPPPPKPPPSPREKMKDAVNQVLQQVAEKKAATRADVVKAKAAKKRRQQIRILQAAVLFIGFGISSYVGMQEWHHPFPAPVGADAERDARKALVFAASLLNQYQAKNGQLPNTIGQLGVPLPGVSYQRSGDNYSVTITVEGHPITFHRDDDPRGFLLTR